MRILITGASGIIGKKLIQKFNSTDHSIRIFSRKKKSDIQNTVEYFAGDIRSIESLEKATSRIDIIIHMAGVTHTHDQKLYYTVNFEGTKNILLAAKKNLVKKFVFVSSRTASINCGAYAHSKLLAERVVQDSGMDWVIVRPSEVYGAGDSDAISHLIQNMKRGFFIPVMGSGKYILCPVYIDDVVDGIFAAATKNNIHNKIYVLGGPEKMTYINLIDRLEKIFQAKKIKIYIPLIFIRFLAFIFSILKINVLVSDQIPRLTCDKPTDISEAVKDLNYKPRSFEDGIKLTL
mgnify:CR=1 FL=1